MKLNSQLVERAKEIKERHQEENEYKGFVHTLTEAKKNKDKWQRDQMVGISFGDAKKNYYHLGAYVLHPWKPWVFVKYPEAKAGWGNDNLASFDLHFDGCWTKKDYHYRDFFDFYNEDHGGPVTDHELNSCITIDRPRPNAGWRYSWSKKALKDRSLITLLDEYQHRKGGFPTRKEAESRAKEILERVKLGRSPLNSYAKLYRNCPNIEITHSEQLKYNLKIWFDRHDKVIRYEGKFIEAKDKEAGDRYGDGTPRTASEKTYWDELQTLLSNAEELYPPWPQGYIDEIAYKLSEEDILKFHKIWASCPSHLVDGDVQADGSPCIYRQREKAWEDFEKFKIQKKEVEKEAHKEMKEAQKCHRRRMGLQKNKTKLKKLYLMKDMRNGLYKIGVSQDPKHRESTLQGEKPDIKLVGDWKDLSDFEREWHKYFDKERQRGEWFKLTKTQVKFFVSQCLKGNAPPQETAV